MNTAALNIYSQRINVTRLIPSNYESLWDFDSGSVTRLLDKIGTNHLTQILGGNNYPTALVGRSKVFSNNTLEANNDISLSFTDGVSDIEVGITMLIKWNSIASSFIFCKRDNFGGSSALNNEYHINYSGTFLQLAIFDQFNSAGSIRIRHTFTPVIGQWYSVQFYYDGSGTDAGLKMYLDGIQPVVSRLTIGTYVSNQNQNSKLSIGSRSYDRAFSFDGELDEIKKSKIVLTDSEALELATKELAGIKVI